MAKKTETPRAHQTTVFQIKRPSAKYQPTGPEKLALEAVLERLDDIQFYQKQKATVKKNGKKICAAPTLDTATREDIIMLITRKIRANPIAGRKQPADLKGTVSRYVTTLEENGVLVRA